MRGNELHQNIWDSFTFYPQKHTANSFIKNVVSKNPYLLPNLAPADYTILKSLLHHHFIYFEIIEGEYRRSNGFNFYDYLRLKTKCGEIENTRLVELYSQLKEIGVWVANQSVYKFHQNVILPETNL